MKSAKKVPKPQAFRSEGVEENNENNINNEINEEQLVIEAFKNFDLDGDGTISVREFVSMLSNYATNLTPYDIDEIIKESKLNSKGTMDYREFVGFWKRMGQ